VALQSTTGLAAHAAGVRPSCELAPRTVLACRPTGVAVVNTQLAPGHEMAYRQVAFVDRYPLRDETDSILTEFGDKSVTWWRHDAEPFALLHADYRLDNLLFGAPGSPDPVIAVDWQACMVGAPLRDVAFVVVSGLSPEDRRAAERDIVAAYHRRLCTFGVSNYGLE
jgi:Ecdysteroid kinase-like family